MGVPRYTLPHWDDLQVMVAQMANKPLLEDRAVSTQPIIGPEANKPLVLDTPLFVFYFIFMHNLSFFIVYLL